MARGPSLSYVSARSVRRQPQFSAIDKSRNLFIVGITALLVLLAAGSIFYIGTHIKVVNLGYKINHEIQRKEQLIEESKRLEFEIARLKSPTRLEVEAKEKLGMTLPAPNQVVYISQLDNPTAMEALAANFGVKPAPATVAPPIPSVPTPPSTKPDLKPSAEKVTEKVAKKPVKKEGPQVLVAKIVEGEGRKSSPSSAKPSFGKTKESVPAVLLDPLP